MGRGEAYPRVKSQNLRSGSSSCSFPSPSLDTPDGPGVSVAYSGLWFGFTWAVGSEADAAISGADYAQRAGSSDGDGWYTVEEAKRFGGLGAEERLADVSHPDRSERLPRSGRWVYGEPQTAFG